MENIHPQDRAYFLNFERLVTSFFNTVPLDKIADYKVQYDLRVSKQDGTYVRLLIQYFLVNYEDRNLYHSLHVHTDITHLQKQGQPSCSIIGLHGAPSYYNIQDQDRVTSGNELFTVREREVLKGIVEGMSSGEIADRLCLSIHTINSHRKNILAKARVRTPLQLIKKLIDKGWI
ncbi:LuxR family transcriptional regulator [Sphingobacterium sp. CZ-UAM]|nr:LuxR family transcriptional regulator [Sphingobacterium sp. CZ-UAM]